MLNNIAIRFNKKDFEYDVYSLVKAFYPQAQITMFYEGEEEAEGEYGMFSPGCLWQSWRFVWLWKEMVQRFSDNRWL